MCSSPITVRNATRTLQNDGVLPAESEWRWRGPGSVVDGVRSDWLLLHGHHKRLAQTQYRTGDLLTESALTVKLAHIRDRLFLDAEPTTVLIVSTEMQDDDRAAAAWHRSVQRSAAKPNGWTASQRGDRGAACAVSQAYSIAVRPSPSSGSRRANVRRSRSSRP